MYVFGLAACTPAEKEDSDGKSVSETTTDELESAVLAKEAQAGDQQIHVWIVLEKTGFKTVCTFGSVNDAQPPGANLRGSSDRGENHTVDA